jgi:pyruvate/2-oxoglutarate dehydrogenase complex dihydrolipoamide acyltransferase (E2) component
MTELRMPKAGSATTATVTSWLVEEGDSVDAGQVVAEIESEKATLELEAPVGGRVQRLLAEPGVELPVGTVIAELETA